MADWEAKTIVKREQVGAIFMRLRDTDGNPNNATASVTLHVEDSLGVFAEEVHIEDAAQYMPAGIKQALWDVLVWAREKADATPALTPDKVE